MVKRSTPKEEKMSQIKGPALFLAQFVQDIPPYNTLESITQWAKDLGFLGYKSPPGIVV